MKPSILLFFILILAFHLPEPVSAMQPVSAVDQSLGFNTHTALAAPSDNICHKALVTGALLVAFVFGTSTFLAVVIWAFASIIGIPIGVGLLYLYFKIIKRALKGRYKRIDERWNRDNG